MSMLLTVAVEEPVLPAASWKLKVNDQFPVNTYQVDHQLLVTVTPVLLNVIDAVTS